MLPRLPYYLKLAWLKGRRRKAIRIEIKKWNTLDENERLERLMDVGRKEIEPFEEDIEHCISSYVANQATKYRLAVPETWHWSKHRHHYLLASEAIRALNIEIHEARKRRGEIFRLWLPAITGIISAVTAVLAVILGRQ